jgi:hypothetical protein
MNSKTLWKSVPSTRERKYTVTKERSGEQFISGASDVFLDPCCEKDLLGC